MICSVDHVGEERATVWLGETAARRPWRRGPMRVGNTWRK